MMHFVNGIIDSGFVSNKMGIGNAHQNTMINQA